VIKQTIPNPICRAHPLHGVLASYHIKSSSKKKRKGVGGVGKRKRIELLEERERIPKLGRGLEGLSRDD